MFLIILSPRFTLVFCGGESSDGLTMPFLEVFYFRNYLGRSVGANMWHGLAMAGA